MFSLNASPSKLPIGLGGQYPPFATMVDALSKNVYPANDGVSDTNGFFYPTNYDTTTQNIINTNIGVVRGNNYTDDGVYTAGGSKIKKFGGYQNKVKRVNTMTIFKSVPTMLAPTISPDMDNVYQVDDTLVFINFTASGVRAMCARVNGDSDLTEGAVLVIDAGALSGVSANRLKTCKISDTEIFVSYINSSHVLKTTILTVDSSTLVCTNSAVHTVITSVLIANSVLKGCIKLDTNKIFVSFVYSSTSSVTSWSYITTVSAGVFTDGSILAVSVVSPGTNTTHANKTFLYGAYIICYSGTSNGALVFTYSGSTLTDVTSSSPFTLPSSSSSIFLIGDYMYNNGVIYDIIRARTYSGAYGSGVYTGYIEGDVSILFGTSSTTTPQVSDAYAYQAPAPTDYTSNTNPIAITADYAYSVTRVHAKNNITIEVDGVVVVSAQDMTFGKVFAINTDVSSNSEIKITNNEASSVTLECTLLTSNVE